MQPEKYQHAEVRATPTPKVLAVPEDNRLKSQPYFRCRDQDR